MKINSFLLSCSLCWLCSIYLSVVDAASIPLSSCRVKGVDSELNAKELLSAKNDIYFFMFLNVKYNHTSDFPCSFYSSHDLKRILTISKVGLSVSDDDNSSSLFSQLKNKCILVNNSKNTSVIEFQVRQEMCNAFLVAIGSDR